MINGNWEFLPSDAVYCSSDGPSLTTAIPTTTTAQEPTPPTPPSPTDPAETTTTEDITQPNCDVQPYS